ncbi:MAG TPA: hypothetical protein H9823_02150 [Candidatus Rubneribacter avistercoris]|nr:hypothetical protein [Candidatus Rubneribacter avistercoris]
MAEIIALTCLVTVYATLVVALGNNGETSEGVKFTEDVAEVAADSLAKSFCPDESIDAFSSVPFLQQKWR